MVLGWILGCVNFETDGREDWRVRCGWMYYTEKCPVYGLKWLKTPPLYICKKIRHFLRWADIRGIGAIIRTFVLFFDELSFFHTPSTRYPHNIIVLQ